MELQNNKLNDLPLTIVLLDGLEILNIANNNISSIPLSLSTLPRLKEFHAHDNPLPFPKKVLQSGSSVISYLKERNQDSSLCYRLKLMCVGQANVGKTSIVERLVSKSVSGESTAGADLGAFAEGLGSGERNRRWSYSEIEQSKASRLQATLETPAPGSGPSVASPLKKRKGKKVDLATDGIMIRDWSARAPKKDGKENIVTFCTWDFAGQEIYYYTHLFFLSRRGIYLLIFNLLKPEEEGSRIEYWLQSIHTRARGAPVILVGTHLDAKKCTKKYLDHLYANLLQKFSGQFKNIRFFFALSCATGKGVEDLRKKIVEIAVSMIEKEGPIPQPYLTLEEKVSVHKTGLAFQFSF